MDKYHWTIRKIDDEEFLFAKSIKKDHDLREKASKNDIAQIHGHDVRYTFLLTFDEEESDYDVDQSHAAIPEHSENFQTASNHILGMSYEGIDGWDWKEGTLD